MTGSDALTSSVNQTIHEVAAATGSIYIDTYPPLKGPSGQPDPTPDLLEDGDHPNATGHPILAAAVMAGLELTGALKSLSADSCAALVHAGSRPRQPVTAARPDAVAHWPRGRENRGKAGGRQVSAALWTPWTQDPLSLHSARCSSRGR